MRDMSEAFELEQYLILPERYLEAPIEAQEMVLDSMGGGPVGIAHHPVRGWFVLMSGQGPFVAWREGEPYTREVSALDEHKITGGEPGMVLDPAPYILVRGPYTLEDFEQARCDAMGVPDY